MGNLSHDLQRKAFSVAVDQTLRHVNKDREKGFMQILNLAQKFMGDNFTQEAYEGAKKMIQNPDGKWM